ncbi:MAG: hypothetical protein HWN67_21945 [Candidatus Helarchaeota archaeon]|nr:hypothetical protein [Candidatus Helarchaeota archaeon]
MWINVLEFTSLIFRVILSIGVFLVAYMFFLKVKEARGTGFDLSQFLGLGIFGLFVGIMEIFFTYYEYYLLVFDLDTFSIYAAATYAGFLGMIGLVFFSEKMFGKTKYAFTIFSIISCISGILFIRTVDALRLLATITLPISVTVVLINFIYSLVVKTKGEIRQKMTYAFIGILGFYFFYMLDTELGKGLLPFPGELTVIISMSGLIITIIWWGKIFLSFETFTEFGWREKMKELFIIAPNGGTLFHYSFVVKTTSKIPDLISAGLSGIKDILAEMIQSKQTLKVVDHQDVKILFEYGTYSTLALVAFENLHIYHSKLALLIEKFENLFQDVLANWKGETEVFIPSKRLIEEIFR